MLIRLNENLTEKEFKDNFNTCISYVKRVAQNLIQGIKVTIEDGPHPLFVPRIPQEFVTKIVKEAQKYDLEVFAHVDDMEEVRIAEKAGVKTFFTFLV